MNLVILTQMVLMSKFHIVRYLYITQVQFDQLSNIAINITVCIQTMCIKDPNSL